MTNVRMYVVEQGMQALVQGYGGRVREGLLYPGRVVVDVDFPSMAQATSCAMTLTRHEHEGLEQLLPRPALSADLLPDATVWSIHAPVALRFVMNRAWMQRVAREAAANSDA